MLVSRGFWDLIIAVIAAECLFITGMGLTFNLVSEHPSFQSSSIPLLMTLFVFFMPWLSLGFTYMIVIGPGGDATAFAGIATLILIIISLLISKVLNKSRILKSLKYDADTVLKFWFIYILAASVLTSIPLSTFTHPYDFIIVTVFAVLGWFAPELFRGKVVPMILIGFNMFIVSPIYILLEASNPALSYPTLHLGEAWMLTLIACCSMLFSRCTYDVSEIHTSRIERADAYLRRSQIAYLVNTSSSFIVRVASGFLKTITYSLLFLQDRMVFFRIFTEGEKAEIEMLRGGGVTTLTGAIAGGIVGAAVGAKLDKELAKSLKETDLKEPRSLDEVSVEEILATNEKNYAIPYREIEKIEMRKPTSELEGKFLAGVILVNLKDNRIQKLTIADKQDFDECKETIEKFLSDRLEIASTVDYRHDRDTGRPSWLPERARKPSFWYCLFGASGVVGGLAIAIMNWEFAWIGLVLIMFGAVFGLMAGHTQAKSERSKEERKKVYY